MVPPLAEADRLKPYLAKRALVRVLKDDAIERKEVRQPFLFFLDEDHSVLRHVTKGGIVSSAGWISDRTLNCQVDSLF